MKVIVDIKIKDEYGHVLCEEKNRLFDTMSRPIEDNSHYIVNNVSMGFSFLSIINEENQNDGRPKE